MEFFARSRAALDLALAATVGGPSSGSTPAPLVAATLGELVGWLALLALASGWLVLLASRRGSSRELDDLRRELAAARESERRLQAANAALRGGATEERGDDAPTPAAVASGSANRSEREPLAAPAAAKPAPVETNGHAELREPAPGEARATAPLEREPRSAERSSAEEQVAARASRESVDQPLASALDGVTDGFLALDAQWRITFINAAAERMYKTPREGLIGRSFWDVFPKLIGSIFEEPYRRAMAERTPVEIDGPYEPMGGWFEVRAFPARDGGLAFAFRDVSERRRDEEEIRRLNRQLNERVAELQTLLDILPVGVWQGDAACERIVGNKAAYEMLGLDDGINASVTAPEARSNGRRGFVCALDGRAIPPDELPMQRAARTGRAVFGVEHDVIFDDGVVKTVYCNVAPLLDADRRVRGVLGAYTDVTERKRSERELAGLAQRLRSLVDNTPLAVVEWDADFRVARWSGRAEEIFGWTADEVVGRRLGEFPWVHVDDQARVDAAVARLADPTVSFVPCKNRNYTKTGEVVALEWYNSVLHDESGRVSAVLSLGLDVTERDRGEEERRRRVDELQTLMEFLPVAVIQSDDRECHRLRGNPAAHRLLRIPVDENLSKTPPPGSPPPRYRAYQNGVEVPVDDLPMQHASRAGVEVRDAEYEIRFENGESRHIYCYATPLFDDAGGVRGCVFAALDISERKRAEARLERERERVQFLADAVPALISYIDADARYRLLNLAYEKWFGRPRGELVGRHMRDVLGESAWEAIRPHVAEVLAGRVVRYDAAVQYREGGLRWIHATYTPDFDDRGAVRGFVAHVFDVTERKRAEEGLREGEARFRSLATAAAQIVWTTDPEGRVHDSPSWREFTGQSFDEYRDFGGFDAIHPDDRERVLTWARECVEKRAPGETEYRLRRRDGEYRRVLSRGVPVLAPDGSIREWVGTITDVTETRRAEAERDRLAATLDAFVAASPVGLAFIDAEYRYHRINESLAALNGLPAAAHVGRLVPEIVPTIWPDVEPLLRKVLDTGESIVGLEISGESIWKAGGSMTVLVSYFPVRLQDESIAGVGVAVLDITERKWAEERLRETNDRLQLAQRAGRLGTWDWDLTTGVTVWSDGTYDLLGLAPGSVDPSAERWREFIHPDDLPAVQSRLAEFVARGGDFSLEFRCRRVDGAVRWIACVGRVEADAEGRAARMIGVNIDVTDRKEAELALRASEERFRLACEAVNGLIYDFDFATERVERTRGLHELYGHRPEDVPAHADWWREQIHPDDRAAMRRAFEAPAGDRVVVEYRVRHQDGRWLHVEDRAVVVRDGEGRPVRLIGCTVDVTERKQAEEILRRQATIFENQNDAIIVTDLAGRILDWNPACERMLGYRKAEVLGRTTAMFHRPADSENLTRDALAAMERDGVWSGAITFVRKDGSLGVCETVVKPLVDDAGRVVGAVGVNRDVTERERAAAELRASEERLLLVRRWSGVGFWYCDEPTQKLVWDDNTKRHFFLPTDVEPTVDDFYHRVHPEDRERVFAAVQASRTSDALFDQQYRAVDPHTGETRWIRSVGRALRAEDGTPLRFDGVTLDITPHKAAEEALREADRRKDEFIATLAHELRNPLAPIRTAVQILKMKGPPVPELMWSRDVIDRQVANMARLLDDLLDVSRITRNKLELRKTRVTLGSAVENAVETSRPIVEAGRHELVVALPDREIPLDADPVRLAQVFSNLLNNAAKYTETGGRITLAAEVRDAEVIVSVTDTGIGIEAEMLPRMFEMFSQATPALHRSQGGLGIGLSLVKGLVEMHGGSVEAKSEGPGRGSEFVVRLPIAADASSVETPASGETAASRPAGRRIVVADDNRDAAASLALMLKMMGNEVRTAHDGQEALDAAEEFRPDAMLLDIGMPRLNGYETARRVRERPWGRDVVLVALTGWGQEEDRRRSSEAGFDHHLVKPAAPDALAKLLHRDDRSSRVR